jgi:fructose-bisphosphate aldolase, class II
MKTLREVLQEADHAQVAVGHFNFSDLTALRAIVEAARDLNLPVLVGVSEGEREFMGVGQVAALVKSFRDETGRAIFLNADHTHSLAKAEEVARVV